MSEKNEITQLILVPAAITLCVTLLRLVGELLNWSTSLFNASPGGGGALIGIAWLIPILGIYFAYRLNQSGDQPASLGKAIGFMLLALVVLIGLGLISISILDPNSLTTLIVFSLACLVPLPIARIAWPKLFNVLMQYGLAARIPVIIVMFFAIYGDWGTHYDAPPDNLPAMSWFTEWLTTGLLPQLTFWLAFTVIFGGLIGIIPLFFIKKKTTR